jgi:hypothetical protein
MGTQTLRPLTRTINAMTDVGATGPTVVNDNLDSSYIEKVISSGGLSGMQSGSMYYVSAYTIPTNSQIRSLTPRFRQSSTNTATLSLYAYVGRVDASVGFLGNSFLPVPVTSSITTQTGQSMPTRPQDGQAWQASDVSAGDIVIGVQMSRSDTSAATVRVYEMYLDVLYNEAPVATPASAFTASTSRPTVTWTYSDPESDVQERYRVKIFDATTASAGGFNPSTSSGAIADSGEVYSNVTSWACNVDLTNGVVYRAFVFVADAGSSGRYGIVSAATYQQITVTLTPPNAPIIVATADNTNGRIQLALSAVNNLNPATTYRFDVERSDNAGVTWSVLTRLFLTGLTATNYQAQDFGSTASPALTVYDYEAKRSTATQYRARVKAFKSGNNLVSAYSSTSSATLAAATTWFVKSLTDANKNISINVHSEDITFESLERQSILNPIGRPNPVVLSDVVGGESFSVELAFLDEASFTAFEALRARRETMLLQNPYGDHRYVRFGGARAATWMLNRAATRKRVVKASFIEVDAP